MRNLEEILRELALPLQALEADRKHCRSKSAFWLLVLLVPLGIGVLAIFLAGDERRGFFLIASFVWFAVGLVLYSVKAGSLASAYRAAYKAEVVPRLLDLIAPRLRHTSAAGISSATFVGTELFATSPDRYASEDLIEGTLGKTFLQLAEVHAEDRRTSTDSKGNTKTTYVTIFKGVLLIADFHKHFQGRTFVFPDTAENLLGNFGRFFQKLGGAAGRA